MAKLLYGETAARAVSERIAAPVASITALRAIPNANCVDGMYALVTADGSRWRFNATSTLTDDGVLVVAPPSGTGRWLLAPSAVTLVLPFTFNTADAALLLTLQAGQWFQPYEFAWRVDTGFTGGASSAIGVSSSNVSGHTTKGDLLGGAAGDVAATLVASATAPVLGTIGAAFATIANKRFIMKPTDTLRFDRVTSAFTAGAGAVLASGFLLKNAGA